MARLLQEVQRVRDVPGLTAELVGRATGADPSTARDWMTGRCAPTGGSAERLIILGELVHQLGLVLQPAAIAPWLQRPIPRLNDDRPIDLLHRKDHLPVAGFIGEMQYPGVA